MRKEVFADVVEQQSVSGFASPGMAGPADGA